MASTTALAGESRLGLTTLPDGRLLVDAVREDSASWLGPAHVAALQSIFPGVRLCPTGGIDEERIAAFLKAGAAMVGAGGRLVDRDALARGDRAAVVANARRYLQHGA